MSWLASDESEGLVIDTGSWKTKAGFSGDDCHRSCMRTVVGHPKVIVFIFQPVASRTFQGWKYFAG